MASSNKTDKLQLPQWQLSDKPEMSDFNDAFNKVEDFKDDFNAHLADLTTQAITSSFTIIGGTGGSVIARYIPFLKMVWVVFNITGVSGTSLDIINFDTTYAPVTTIRGSVRGPSASGQMTIGIDGKISVTMDSATSVVRETVTWFTV